MSGRPDEVPAAELGGGMVRRPPRWRRWALDVALVLAVVFGVGAWQTRSVPAGEAPGFIAQDVGGGRVTLQAWREAHAGRAMLLYFWADWCPVCRSVQGAVDGLSADWPVLSVAMQSGGVQEVAAVLRARELAWATVVDPEGAIAAQYGLRGVPAFIIIDPAGQIRFAEMGYTTAWGLRLRLWWAQWSGAV